MSRRRPNASQGSVSLFPFLAVLICTMGSLIVLLVILVQQARQSADLPIPELQKAEPAGSAKDSVAQTPPDGRDSAKSENELEDLQWQIEALRSSRETTAQRVREQQLQLSMVEDQIRQLQTDLDRLEREAEAYEAARDHRLAEEQAIQQELTRLRNAIELAKRNRDEARQKAEKNRRAYALVPYHGTQGTTRRPIYVECLKDYVLLQPEGVRLVASDFEDPLGPDNPLAAALRATREYWLNTRVIDSSARAYPLLIVRPEGAHTYAACRAAMQGWDDEFGYELIPESMELAYPKADPALRNALTGAVEDSRVRTDRTLSGSGLGTGNGSGVGSVGGPLDEFGAMSDGRQGQPSRGPNGSGYGNGTGTPGNALGGGNGGSNSPQGNAPNQAGPGGSGMSGANGFAGGTTGSGPDASDAARAAANGTGNGTASGGMQGNGGSKGSGSGSNSNSGSASGTGSGPQGVGGPGGPSATPGGGASAAGGTGGVAGPGLPSISSGQSTSGPADAELLAGGAPTGEANGNSTSIHRSTPGGGAPCLAETRGENWALPNSASGSIGMTRPVAVRCESSRVVLLPESGMPGEPVAFRLDANAADQVQPFVEAIWQRIESWGLAGSGAYWKPILRVEVAPGAEADFAQLSQLLDRSGLVIERRN